MTDGTQTGEVLTRTQQFESICKILEEFEYREEKLIPILQRIQDVYHYLPKEIIEFVANSIKIPASRIYGVATFYSHFTLEPKGKHLIRCCNGTACHVKQSIPIINAIRKKLNMQEGKNTSDDLLFSIEIVSCLGACGLAPVVVIDGEVHGQMSPAKVEALLDKILKKEAGNE
ncbi:MAG: NAD(P)H-dependent oxidoreductase subunit E [Bdellovibrionota bacterium]|nr:NAD(P)H-dependent oxidoreductase subunit E [Pseudomonadota bacterium]MDY6090146.1 NAD(P)H-dependent oxidoreductase subunit E [Bdellovibrionota bacterium]